jgi:hypothetical protein
MAGQAWSGDSSTLTSPYTSKPRSQIRSVASTRILLSAHAVRFEALIRTAELLKRCKAECQLSGSRANFCKPAMSAAVDASAHVRFEECLNLPAKAERGGHRQRHRRSRRISAGTSRAQGRRAAADSASAQGAVRAYRLRESLHPRPQERPGHLRITRHRSREGGDCRRSSGPACCKRAPALRARRTRRLLRRIPAR